DGAGALGGRGGAAAAAAGSALAAYGVDLVEEDYGGRGGAGAAEEVADGALRLAHVHVEQLGALDGEKVERGLGGHGLGGEGLGATGRAVEEQALGRGDDAGDGRVCLLRGGGVS